VARTHLTDNLKRLSDLHNYMIEPGDPDPRGWTVNMPDGRRVGTVTDLAVDESVRKVRYLIVQLDPATAASIAGATARDEAFLAAEDADLDTPARRVTARQFSNEQLGLTGTSTDGAYDERTTARARTDEPRLTRSEEELHIDKREVERGEARVGKRVETEHVREPVTRRREEVVVEHRPVESGARASAIGEGEVRVPLTEEELVVEKRPVVKEEVIVGKRTVEDREVVEEDLKRERIDIDRNTERSGTIREGRTRRDR
jgi:uncharacterized protein (TIGR02271 family)